ncbi:MAG: type II secretion system protein GspL [Pseudomonadota bacterium]
MNYLCIQLHADSDPESDHCDWLLLDNRGDVISSGQHCLAELAEHHSVAQEYRTIVLLAGDKVRMSRVHVADQHIAHLKTVVPYLVEENLAENLEDVHVAMQPNGGAGENSVAIVSHAELIDCLDLLYTCNLEPYMIVPDYLGLPDYGSGVRILFECDRVLIQFSEYQGTTVEPDLLSTYLKLHFQQAANSDAQSLDIDDINSNGRPLLTLMAQQGDAEANRLLQHFQTELLDYKIDEQLFSETPVALRALTIVRNRERILNLLQGGYRARADDRPRFPWRWLAAVASIFLVAEIVMLSTTGWWFSARAEQLAIASEQHYREVFPREKRVVDPQRQFQSHLNRQQGSGFSAEFLYLMEAVTSSMEDQVLPIQSIRYDAYGEGMVLDISADKLDDLELYTRKLKRLALDVDLLSAVEQSDGVRGRVMVARI